MPEGLNTADLYVSLNALVRFRQRRTRMGLDDTGGNFLLLEAMLREVLAVSTPLKLTDLRNWRELKKHYPSSTYYRHERFVLVVDKTSKVLVTCFLYTGRGATRRKPRTGDARASAKEALRRHLHEGKEL